jgi:hypothetical protein
MTSTSVHRRRGLGARLVPFIIALGALPLLAPTCGSSGEGVKVFSRRSLIIPMDVCYQYTTDSTGQTYQSAGGTTECPTRDAGDVIRAYGLVYQLVRSGIAVYWVIDNNKQSVTGVDLTVQYDGGVPVYLFNWSTGVEGNPPSIGNGGHLINYRGGPFVVDGSDFLRASTVLQAYATTFGNVNVHVSNVAFRGYSKRTMAGGWSAGGATPPKLALLDIGSNGSGAKNSEVVIRQYLTRAGLDTTGAMGYANPAQGPHGQIFDRLFEPDFLGSPWTNSRLSTNGYQILWIPHWDAPSSCSDCPPSTSCTCTVMYPQSEIAQVLKNIGSFVNDTSGGRAPGDLFAECAGLGSFEGVFSSRDPSGYSTTFVLPSETATGGEPSTHFQTWLQGTYKTGFWINQGVSSAKYDPAALYQTVFASPLMQIGDYQFVPQSGAIQNFRTAATTPPNYKPGVVRMIYQGTSPAYDIFTHFPGDASHGTVVYLGGHDYAGADGGNFSVPGSRLVLNTLFNLGAACVANSGVQCSTGLPGVCGTGHYACQGGPDPVCIPDVQPGELQEICNGLDDDCDGQVDEGLQISCYDRVNYPDDPFPSRSFDAFMATSTVGLCHAGVSVCQKNPDNSYAMSACTGQVRPAVEQCNGLDDDCNGVIDDPSALPTISCYDGPPATRNVGACRPGEQVCHNGQWGGYSGAVFTPGLCANEVLPKAEVCSDAGPGQVAVDDDCNGVVNNGCTCDPGDGTALHPAQTQLCFTGPGTAGLGICHAGLQTCETGGYWGNCVGQSVASTTPEDCVPAAIFDAGNIPTGYDINCDGKYSRCKCSLGQTEVCDLLPTLPPGASWGTGQCQRGIRTCDAYGVWGDCTGTVSAATDAGGAGIEYCDGVDNDCNGQIDENAICPTGQTCLDGVCVQQFCGTERPAPEGYTCTAAGVVQKDTCGGATCGNGDLCQYGHCVDPCPTTTINGKAVSSVCATGTTCGGGACIAGGCYEAGCGSGLLCLEGTCQADPCANKLCPSGTFCRQGDCVQACTFVTCYVGEKCGIDGFCEADPCSGKACLAGQKCTNGSCAADPCLGKGCAAGQICQAQGTTPVCVDDPCTGVVCPAGICASGQCFPSGNPTGAGTASRTTGGSKSSGGCGCGSGSGIALPGLLALLAAPLARRRRRAAPGGRGTLLLVLVSVALATTACKTKKTSIASNFDPSSCKSTCSGEERCVDLTSDPSHCGACGHVCGAGEQCVDSVCGPTSLVAPYLRSINPTTGAKDNPNLVVALAGDRFQQGVDVRATVTSPSGSTSTRTIACDTAVCTAAPCCQWLSTSALSAHVDLTDASPVFPWMLRVVNPDGVISNSRSLTVQIPTPSITSVSQTSIPSGTSATLIVHGTGFTSGSYCQLSPSIGVLPTSYDAAAGTLSCALDGTNVQAGSYTLTVVSEQDASGQTHTSAGVTFTVMQSDPVVFTVTPAGVDPGAATTVASFRIDGLRFDASSVVLFYRLANGESTLPAANVTLLGSSAILVHGLTVGNGTTYPPDSYTVQVRNTSTSRTSNAVAFTVGAASTVAVTSFTPTIAYQGESVSLQFTGTSIPNPSWIEIEAPGATSFTALTATTVNGSPGTTATVPMSFAGQPAGQWYVRLRFGTSGSSPTSTQWPLRILSNQVILRDYAAAPAPAQAGSVGTTKTSLVFDVANILGSSARVSLVDPDGVTTRKTWTVATTPGAATVTVSGSPALDLTGYATGTYTFAVANPNGAPSNGLNFAVNAGAPSLSSVCLLGTSCQRWGVQGQATTLRLTGTNFAAADANGNGSVVMAAADFMANWPKIDPCNVITTTGTQFQVVPGTVTVVSPTEIDVSVDTLSAFVDPSWGTTYYVGVWNPGGVSGLQKSSCGVAPTALPWFRLCAKASGTTCTQ